MPSGYLYTNECKACGKEFQSLSWNGTYCSKLCRDSARNRYPVGTKVGRLTVLGFSHYDKHYQRKIHVRCECGNEKIVNESQVRFGATRSCGCGIADSVRVRKPRMRHGMKPQGKATPEYRAYTGAKIRCTHEGRKDWENYGGRGIEFRFTSFEQFYDEVGPRPSNKHSLDRINVNGHYEPGNVRWATWTTQMRNRRCDNCERLEKEIAELRQKLAALN